MLGKICMQEFLKGGALLIDRRIEKRAPPVVKTYFRCLCYILMTLKSHYKTLLVVSGGEQMQFEFMTKICNCCRLFDDPGGVVPKLSACISYRS